MTWNSIVQQPKIEEGPSMGTEHNIAVVDWHPIKFYRWGVSWYAS